MNKVALVTGSSRGIGKNIIKKFAEENYDVIINYNKSEKEANELKNQIINKNKVKVLSIKADITNEKEIKNMIARIVKEFGKIDVLVNNASIALDNLIGDKTKEEFMKVLETNVVGTFLTIKYASKYLNNGIIINISSTDAVDTFNELSIDYCASKAAINSLTQTLSLALPNIKIISLMPLWVNTDTIKEMNQNYLLNELKRTNQKRLLEEQEVANKVVELVNSDILSGSIVRMVE
ncbi:MAG: SDR family oxidoreductase [Bacilli bacterium]